MKYFLKTFPALIFWGAFAYVVLQVPYPKSITAANYTQILPFLASLYLALVLTLNILFKNILFSASVCLGLIFILILKALDSLNIVTAILIIVATYLLAGYFWKTKRNLTKQPKIPKLQSLR
ncbi:hypothetical protein A3J19_03010 [Candidatus Daviesbacteria bacterium RIFCSPLOWO2_02_FULL_41_8]|uniref:Uncharacterized protein n=2 Tax=Candidatus Daviesiibacteriota TaxID=1752718 RepID=A0A1F5NM48_9BACT|nr:MAG: hypothetical protein A2871_03870 [Candidatus Daviesbacteria bacterium RIFCSPHIGHO2_01_FULL_41_23]OGE62320.1 MAG: hypothetical protein A2967_02600 [Candidatus Daviesbacteria bacterium RIFCSPLOWO2_01_FULL_41_32]OGE78735.1 MAG: hypothetical protein A3J19_03010 [Candidatus Daviesbacteria bacterium RIFCSPLOWO2_02_FULL_41_8]